MFGAGDLNNVEDVEYVTHLRLKCKEPLLALDAADPENAKPL